MMKRVRRDQVTYGMSPGHAPVLCVASGERFCLETKDCYSDTLKRPEDVFDKEKVGGGNPGTGPVCIEGAKPGDVLRVDIEKIQTREFAAMRVLPGVGALGHLIEETENAFFPIKGQKLELGSGLSVPIVPMIGVIGTAPAGTEIPNSTPGEHGGNMDCKEIAAGASVYLPVYVEGALLSLGDIHAVQGDGEVCICAAEVSGEVTLRATVLATPLPTPCVENATHVMFLGSALTLDECERMVLDKAHRYLTGCLACDINEAARLMSLLGELRVCQVVDPLKTMKFMFPKAVLQALGMGERAADLPRTA